MASDTENWKSITRKNYDLHAKHFADHTTIFRGKLGGWMDRFTGELPQGSRILDIGSGAGRDAAYMVERGFDVTGIDFSSELVRIAKKNVSIAQFQIMDFEEMDFPSDSFDGVWASASLLHVPRKNLLPVLKNIHTILKEGGLFFSLFRLGEGEKFTVERRGGADLRRFYAYYQPKELQALLGQAGFSNIQYEFDAINSGDWVGFFARK